MKAKTVAQVVAAEAGGKTLKDRFQAMQDVFSAMFNRAEQTGVPVKDIASVKSQFSAYNSPMPAGTQSLVGMAQRAINAVLANGPTHKGTYYATPDRVSKLPGGLKAVKTSVDGMKYYSDPKDRSIVTAVGAKKPSTTTVSYAKNLPASTSTVPQHAPSRIAPATPGFNLGTIAAKGSFQQALAARQPSAVAQAAPAGKTSRLGPQTAMRDYGWTGGVTPGQSVAGIDPNTPGVTRGLSTFDVQRAITPGQAQARVAQERARVAAETEANKSVFTKAGEQVAGLRDTIGGFFDSLAGQTAVAEPTRPNNVSTPKTDRLAKTATYSEVMKGTPVKTTSIPGVPETKPAAVYDDPRALAYAQNMQQQPVDSLYAQPAIDPELAAKVTPDQPVTVEDVAPVEEAAVRQRVQRRTPAQVTVNRPNRVAVDPTAGMTLGGVKAADRFSVGSGLRGVTNALGGPYGATAQTSNRSVSVTNRGALGSFRYNKDTGVTQFSNPAGATTGVSYGKPGGFLGALGRALGGAGSYGGSKSGKSSSSEKSGKSGGAKGAAGGSLGQSQHSL